jgi:hypothetical protein
MLVQLLKNKVEEKNANDVEYNKQILIQNPIVKRYILKAFKIPSWIHQSISGLFQVLGAQYSDLLSPLETIERVMLGADTFVLHRIGDNLPNETTIGAAIHMKFMRLEEDLIKYVHFNCMLLHAGRPIPVFARHTSNKDVCMHPRCCVQGLKQDGHSDHEWRHLTGGRESNKLPMNLLAKLIDLTNPNRPRLYPILDQIQLMLKMNPGKYQTFEAMFGPTESHLLHQWWKFAEESATMRSDILLQYCSSQDKVVFLDKLSETVVIYVRVSIATLTVTEVYNVTDNRLTDNQFQKFNEQIPFFNRVISNIFRFEENYAVSMESVKIFHAISKDFMKNQILRMHQHTRARMMFQYPLHSLTISQKFKVTYLLTYGALMAMLVDRLVPTDTKRDPSQANNKLSKMVHFYASPSPKQ